MQIYLSYFFNVISTNIIYVIETPLACFCETSIYSLNAISIAWTFSPSLTVYAIGIVRAKNRPKYETQNLSHTRIHTHARARTHTRTHARTRRTHTSCKYAITRKMYFCRKNQLASFREPVNIKRQCLPTRVTQKETSPPSGTTN